MRIDPQFASAVTFLTVSGEPDAQRNAPALPVGTAFLIGEPLGDTGKTAPWLVTARHVIDRATTSDSRPDVYDVPRHRLRCRDTSHL